jgi:hypothetical protein
MTEDILFDNIYVGHSVEDAQALAAETFGVKKPLEVADEEAKEKVFETEDEMAAKVSFKDDPVEFVRQKVFTFIDLAKLDPLLAFKTHPKTGASLAGAVFTLFGMVGALLGLIGGSQKPITKVRLFSLELLERLNDDCPPDSQPRTSKSLQRTRPQRRSLLQKLERARPRVRMRVV